MHKATREFAKTMPAGLTACLRSLLTGLGQGLGNLHPFLWSVNPLEVDCDELSYQKCRTSTGLMALSLEFQPTSNAGGREPLQDLVVI